MRGPQVSVRDRGIRDAQQVARRLIHRYGGTTPDAIDVDIYARAQGIEVETGWVPGGTAILVRGKQRSIIRVSATESDEHTLRWSIAHEIGHAVLEHPTTSAGDVVHPVRRDSTTESRDYEAEANAFASELLMPRELVHPVVRSHEPTLEPGHVLVGSLNVSILAASRRVVELSTEPCAAVFSAYGRVTWVTHSATFGEPIRKGQRLDPASVAARFFLGQPLATTPRLVQPRAWWRERRLQPVVEHAVASIRHQTVLSMLWVPRGPAPEFAPA